MSGPVHTYGPTCHRSTPKQDLVAIRSSPSPPEVNAQFFYISSLPIDDPLTPLPAAATSASARTASTPQPFSARDNVALEQAWRALSETFPTESDRGKDKSMNTTPRTRWDHSFGDTAVSAPGPSQGLSVPSGMSMEQPGEDKQSRRYGSFGPSTWPKKRNTSPLGRQFKSAKRNSTSSPGEEEQEIHPPESNGESYSRVFNEEHEGNNNRNIDAGKSGDDIKASGSNQTGVKNTEPSQEETEDSSTRYKIPIGVSRLHLVELPGLKVTS